MEQEFLLSQKQFGLVIKKPPFSQITINIFKFQIIEQQGFFVQSRTIWTCNYKAAFLHCDF
jgi:hypothetical protein